MLKNKPLRQRPRKYEKSKKVKAHPAGNPGNYEPYGVRMEAIVLTRTLLLVDFDRNATLMGTRIYLSFGGPLDAVPH